MPSIVKTFFGAGSRQAWLLLGAALAVTALIGLLLSAPAAVTRAPATPAAAESSQTALFWAVTAAVVLLLVAVLLGVMLQLSLRGRRRAMALVSRLTRSLNQSEAALRAVRDSSQDAIIMLDAAGFVLSFNRAAERLFGFRAAELLGQHVALLLPERDREPLRQTLQGQDPLDWGRQADRPQSLMGLRRDGLELPLQLRLHLIDLAGPRRLVAVLRATPEACASAAPGATASARIVDAEAIY